MQASVVQFSDLENQFTIGAEFYSPYYIQIMETVKKKQYSLLSNCCKLITDGDHSATQYTDAGILYLLSESVKEGYIEKDIYRYISSETHTSLKRSQLKPRDVLLTKTGAYFGKSAVIPNAFPDANTSAHVGRLVLKDTSINPYYLSTFFNCKYGYAQLRRRGIKVSRPEIKLVEFADIVIVRLLIDFQDSIEKIILAATQIIDERKNKLKLAEQSLITKLDMLNARVHCNSFVKPYADVGVARRFDAEYYHPKYDELFFLLQQNAQYCRRVEDIAAFNGRGVSPEYEENGKLRFINSQHILEQGLDYDGFDRTNEDNWKKQSKARVFRNDILTYSTGANVGRTATYLEDLPALAGIDVNILRLKEENPVYVGFVMNSMIGRMQTRRQVTGSAQAHLYASDIDQFIIPFVEQATQDEIVQCVLNAHEAKKTARALLDAAKRAVEMAIEENETAAEAWLRGETERLGVKL